DGEAVLLFELARDQGPQGMGSRHRRVAGEALLDRLPAPDESSGRGAEVRLAGTQRDHVAPLALELMIALVDGQGSCHTHGLGPLGELESGPGLPPLPCPSFSRRRFHTGAGRRFFTSPPSRATSFTSVALRYV